MKIALDHDLPLANAFKTIKEKGTVLFSIDEVYEALRIATTPIFYKPTEDWPDDNRKILIYLDENSEPQIGYYKRDIFVLCRNLNTFYPSEVKAWTELPKF